MKEAVSRKKDAHKAICQNSTGENKSKYKSMKNAKEKFQENAAESKEREG